MKKFDNELQGEFISQYNELHKIFTDLSIPYYQRVAAGDKVNHKTKPKDAQEYLDREFKPFMKAVYGVIEDNEFIYRRLTDLHKIHDLRNLIVHQYSTNDKDGYTFVNIAQPTNYSLDLINEILTKFKKPITIKEYLLKYNKNKVTSVNTTDDIYDLFKVIKENNFTQFPVFENQQYKGQVSSNGITLRLSHAALEEKDFGSLELFDLKVSDFLDVDELKDEYEIVNSNEYLYTVLKHFEINEEKTQLPVILVISEESTKEDFTPQSLIGILNSYDYLDIYKEAISKISF